jgi:hypothetical protein
MKVNRRLFTLGLYLSVFFSAMSCEESMAQIQIVIDEPPRPLYYERTQRIKKFKDWNNFRDMLHWDKLGMGRRRFMGNVSWNTGRVLLEDENHKVHKLTRSAMGYFFRYRFLEEFSANVTFYHDYNEIAHTHWIADYSYSIGRYSWEDRKLNFGYENYIDNKYTDDAAERWDKFLQGYYYVAYNRFLGDKLAHAIALDSTSGVRFVLFARYAFKYLNNLEESIGNPGHGKPWTGLSARWIIFRNVYVEGAVYYYFNPEIYQQPWDPDYTYGFGYYNWRSFRISLTYGNWAINRFPWNKTFYPHYGFEDGNFRVLMNWIW